MDWKSRISNKTFWLTLIPAALLLIQVVLAVFGVTFDFTEIGNKIVAVVNALFAVLAILGIVANPITPGITDTEKDDE